MVKMKIQHILGYGERELMTVCFDFVSNVGDKVNHTEKGWDQNG